MYSKDSHTFVICAYGNSPYLESCIQSLLSQTVRTKIVMSASEPEVSAISLAEKYQIPLFVNKGEKGIAGDWNFALSCAETPLVTLAHQDDRYYKTYAEDVLAAFNTCCRPLLAFTDYNELREGRTAESNRLLKIKRLMLSPLRLRFLQKSRFVRRRILSLGNPICCPSVTFVRENLPGFSFQNNMDSNIDWQAWEELSRRKGEFVYIPVPSMEHRIHPDSATSSVLKDDRRRAEDMAVLEKFWGRRMAAFVEHFYSSSEKSNKLSGKESGKRQ